MSIDRISMRILLIEDEQKVSRFVALGLKAERFAVDTAEDGKNGLRMATVNPYDLLIVDIAMPTMDGMTLLRELRADIRYMTLPIIMLTASVNDHDRHEAMLNGANLFLTKPVSSTELGEVVNSLLTA